MNGFPRDSGEAQGLRIGYKFMKFNETQTPSQFELQPTVQTVS